LSSLLLAVNSCHFVTRRVTVCHFPLWLGPRSAPGNSSQALSRRHDKIIFYRMRACITRMEHRFRIRIEFKNPGRPATKASGHGRVTVACAAPRHGTFAVTLLALASPRANCPAAAPARATAWAGGGSSTGFRRIGPGSLARTGPGWFIRTLAKATEPGEPNGEPTQIDPGRRPPTPSHHNCC
jgi:hypothetical protein